MNFMDIQTVLRGLRGFRGMNVDDKLVVNDELVDACVSMKIATPTACQTKAIASTLGGVNSMHYVGPIDNRLTPLTFIIPILNSLFLDKGKKRFMACIICDDYAKSVHIAGLISSLGLRLGVKCEPIFIKDAKDGSIEELLSNPHILAATPDCLTLYLKRKNNTLNNKEFADLRYLVFLEAKEFKEINTVALNEGLFDNLESRKNEIQTFFLSNSNNRTDEFEKLVSRFGREPFEVIVEDNMAAAEANGSPNIDELKIFKCIIDAKLKENHIIKIIRTSSDKCVVFTKSRDKTAKLVPTLTRTFADYRIFNLSITMNKIKKEEMLAEFGKDQEKTILVCSDADIRGFRIPVVGMYISTDILKPEDFVYHRLVRAKMSPDIGTSRKFVQLLYRFEIDRFREILDLVFFVPDKTKPEFEEQRRNQLDAISDYPLTKTRERKRKRGRTKGKAAM